MLRLSIIIALSALLIFLIKLGFEGGQGEPLPEPDILAKPASVLVPMQGKINFYPPVPAHLPDLNEGYLFNEERHVEGEDEPVSDERDDIGEFWGDFDDVRYVGSIISGKLSKGIVSYPVQKKKRARTSSPGQYSGKNLNYARLVVGDKFSGYKVTGVFPDKMIFEKSGETTEKLLYDTEKQRIVAPVVTRQPKKSVQSLGDKNKSSRLSQKNRSMVTTGRRLLPRASTTAIRRNLAPDRPEQIHK
ncbi:MAG: hypothetical protein KAJ45_00350 [Desulfobulbaceae bacterium]|nr:hypothetical protein [Desulfobulbaceae bacterium]